MIFISCVHWFLSGAKSSSNFVTIYIKDLSGIRVGMCVFVVAGVT